MSEPFKNKKVLHITTHLGGGVGTVLINFLKKASENSDFTHKVMALGYTEEASLLAIKELGILYWDHMASDHSSILSEVKRADVVLIHWWNHPLMYDFLVRRKLPESRVIIWSHVSGFYSPHVFTEKLLNYPDLLVFTTPISFNTKEIENLPEKGKKKLKVVLATGGLNRVASVKPKAHRGFNIGYLGTVDYAKIHRNFLHLCNKVNIPEAKFIVCGGLNEKEMASEAQSLGILDKFNFTGLVSDIENYFSVFDIFGYPLAPHHYGASDQTLIESMAAGVVPVVLNNQMEQCMVKHNVTGIVAKDENDYVRSIQTLYEKRGFRDSLSVNARKYANDTYSVQKMTSDWKKIFDEVLKLPKSPRKWPINKKEILAKDIFLESLGVYGQDFAHYLNAKSGGEKREAANKIQELGKDLSWQSKTKGTVHNYNFYFSHDRYLSLWSKLMKNINN